MYNLRAEIDTLRRATSGAGFRPASQTVMTPDARNREGQREVRLILKMREFEQERRRVSERHGDKVAAIRAFGWQPSFCAKLSAVLDLSQRPFYMLFCV